MHIKFALSREEVLQCWPAISELRPHLKKEEYLHKVQQLYEEGVKMLMLEAAGAIPTVAVFRINHYFHRGKNLYIDDLVSLPSHRGKGYARAMLEWIKDYAIEMGCENIHLDSGYQRYDAHRFYLNFGFKMMSHHFVLDLME